MVFCYEPDANKAAWQLSERLNRELADGKHVLWLVCCGSSIALETDVMRRVPADLQQLLTVALTDERYGNVDHPDSNWRQLHEAGFEPGKAKIIPTLVPNLSLAETVEAYQQAIEPALENAEITIATFGIGADGHIAGALPHSPAVSSNELA